MSKELNINGIEYEKMLSPVRQKDMTKDVIEVTIKYHESALPWVKTINYYKQVANTEKS